MDALSAANDATAASFATVEAAATSGGATLATVGADVVTDAAATGEATLSFTSLGDAMTYVDAQAALAASALATTAASTDTVTASALAAIPSVADLDAQFAYMKMNLAAAAAEADSEAAAMQFNAEMHAQAAAAMNVARDAAVGLATVLGVAALAAGVIGAVSLKMAGDFQSSITTLETGAGELHAHLDMVSAGILQMAVDTGTSTQQLVQGMYMIESAGFHGAAGLDILRAAAEGARVGEASLADVANGVTTEMTDYAASGITAAQATNILIAAVSLGKTHMQDLAQSLSAVLPAASAAGVGLKDVMAAMATMTAQGTPAANAATYLRQMIIALEAPAAAGSKALTTIGLTTAQVAAEMKVSLPGALQLIMQHLAETYKVGSPQYIAALKAIAGGSKQMQGILELTGSHLKTFANNLKTLSASVKAGGKDIAGWSAVQKDFNFQIARAAELLKTGLIKLGLQLLPIVTPLIKGFADWASNGKAVASTFASVGAAFAPVIDFVRQLWNYLAPFGAFVKATFVPVWDQLKATLQILKPVWDQLVAAIKPAMPALKVIAEILGGILLVALMVMIKTIAMFAQGVILAVSLIVGGVMLLTTSFLKFLAFISDVVKRVVGFFQWLYHQLVGGSIIPDLVNGIVRWFERLRSLWSAIVSYIVNWVVSQFLHLATAIASHMLAIVTNIQAKLNQIRSYFLSLIGQAVQWGENLINNFLKGLQAAWQGVVSWFTSALNWLKSLWPHSPVKEGPLKGSEKWGDNFMKNIADGLRRGFPEVQGLLNRLSMPLSPSSGFGGSMPPYRISGLSGVTQPLQITIQAAPIFLDSRELVANGLGQEIARQYLVQNGFNTMPPLRA